jgi:hypothetical protein
VRVEPKQEVVEVKKEKPDEAEVPAVKSDAPVVKNLTPRKKADAELVAPAPSFVSRKAPAIALTVVAGAGAITGIALGAASADQVSKARAAEFESDFLARKKDAEGLAVGANVSYGVAAASAVVALVLWVTGN